MDERLKRMRAQWLVWMAVVVLLALAAGSCGDTDDGSAGDAGSGSVDDAGADADAGADGDAGVDDTADAGGADSGAAEPPGELMSQLVRDPDPSAAAVPEVVGGANEFGLAWYRLLAADRPEADVVLSPVSVALAFAMLRAGASGDTASQLDAAFGYPDDPHEAMNALDLLLEAANRAPENPEDGEVILEVANSVWGQAGLAFGEDFLDTLAANYGAGLRTVDFAADPEGAIEAINAWAAEKTRGRIAEPVSALPPQTILMLLNAIYLKASWLSPFDEAATAPETFTRADGSTVETPMMRQTLPLAHHVAADHVAVAVPYVGNELRMVLVVPDDLAAFEAGLDTATLQGLLGELTVDGDVALTLPRWEAANELPLLDQLAALGVTDLGGLEGITPGAAVADAYQVANITVDERGTEAAAVTVVAVATSAPEPTVPVPIRVDRPFLWLIEHEPSGTILFLGRTTGAGFAG